MRLRMISRGIVAALVVVVGLVILVHNHQADGRGSTPLVGTDLGGTAAPDFTLADQTGASVALRGLRGHPVVVTFLYTHCPDECPLTAEKLRMTANQLGGQAGQVSWVAISVDPSGDTADAAKAFVHAHGLDGRLHYLIGSQQQLAPVWKAYSIYVEPGSGGEVNHAGAVYVLDGQGHERVFLDSTFAPSQLAGDLRALLGGA